MKTYTDELTPLDSACEVYAGANWYEREVCIGFMVCSMCMYVCISVCFVRSVSAMCITLSLETLFYVQRNNNFVMVKNFKFNVRLQTTSRHLSASAMI